MSSSEPEQAPAASRHVCAGCGASLEVAARHLGRRLRCSRCGTEFVASAAADAESVAGPGSERAEETRRPRDELPTSYSHTCTACGARFVVHARYYGRSLRCSGCGTEFRASPPPFVPLSPRASSAADPRAKPTAAAAPESVPAGGRLRRLLLAGAAVAALGAGLWWLGTPHREGVGSGLVSPVRARGSIAELRPRRGALALAALDRDTAVRLVAAVEGGDEGALAALRSSSHCLELEAGTRVRVLEGTGRGRQIRVRILDGQWASRVVWVPVSSVR